MHPLDVLTQPKAKGRMRMICLVWLIEPQNRAIQPVKYLGYNDLILAVYIHQTK